TTDVGGIPEILGLPGPGPRRVEGLGTLVTPGDDQGLATAIAELLATPAEPTRVRAYAERWGWEEPVALLTKTFRDALAEVAV
ncbi:MAG: hypothetical protein KDE27_06595, partial [Planctomycetes bacterium]|nr:hypothetical protein [Planctomycetota bacterium]